VPPAQEFNLYSYKFNDTLFGDSTTLKIVLRMFMDFDLMNKFSIPHNVVCRWALSVKKNYRPVKYHNWRHALNVCQTMFTVLKTGKMERFMEDMEVFGLLVACLCHDLDHRGTNNSYQTKVSQIQIILKKTFLNLFFSKSQVDSPLAVLYSTATMEHHHFDQCVMILSSEGNNIFQGLSTEEYRYVMKVVEQAILSTDLASYFEKRERFVSTADDGEIDWQVCKTFV
jgi:cGMP-specific 3',5'-cyclic phosphodiesterase